MVTVKCYKAVYATQQYMMCIAKLVNWWPKHLAEN